MENRQQNIQQGVIYESKKLSGKPQQVNWNVDTSFSKSITAASNCWWSTNWKSVWATVYWSMWFYVIKTWKSY